VLAYLLDWLLTIKPASVTTTLTWPPQFPQSGIMILIGILEWVQCDPKTESMGSHWLSQFTRWRTNLKDHASVTLWKISLTETLCATICII